MVRRTLQILFAMFAFVLASQSTGSAKMLAWHDNSIEWLCECKRHVAIGRLVSWTPRSDEPTFPHRGSGLVRVETTLKGRPPREARLRGEYDPPLDLRRPHRLLLFFDDSLRVDAAIALDDSTLHLDPPITMACTLATDGRDILKAVRRRLVRLRREGRGSPGSLAEINDRQRFVELAVPGFPAPSCGLDDSYGGVPTDFVIVPADAELRSRSLSRLRSPNPRERAGAALLLGAFPGRRTVEALRPLLSDSARESVQVASTPPHWVRYSLVREAAYRSLQRLGERVPRPADLVEGEFETWVVEDLISSYQSN